MEILIRVSGGNFYCTYFSTAHERLEKLEPGKVYGENGRGAARLRFSVENDTLSISAPDGSPPLTLSNEQDGWFRGASGASHKPLESDWRCDLLEAVGLPASLLRDISRISQPDDRGRERSCNISFENARPGVIAKVYVTLSCTREELAKCLVEVLDEIRFRQITAEFVLELAKAYWDCEAAREFFRGNAYETVEANWGDDSYQSNPCIVLNDGSEHGSQISLGTAADDCGLALVFRRSDYHASFLLVPGLAVHEENSHWLWAAKRLLKRHGWRVFDQRLGDRHRQMLEALDQGALALAAELVATYQLEVMPGLHGEEAVYYLGDNTADRMRGSQAFLTRAELLRHSLGCAVGYLKWGEEFLLALESAAPAPSSTWVTCWPRAAAVYQTSDGLLECRWEREGPQLGLGPVQNYLLLTADHFAEAADLIDGQQHYHAENAELRSALQLPYSGRVVNGYVRIPQDRPITVIGLLRSGKHSDLRVYVRAVQVLPGGQVQPLAADEVRERFRYASEVGAALYHNLVGVSSDPPTS